MHTVSLCCNGEVTVQSGDEGTSFYLCTVCKFACDTKEIVDW